MSCENLLFAYVKAKVCGYRADDQRFYFHFIASTNPLIPKYKIFKLLAIFYGCRVWFVSDVVGNPDKFPHDAAHVISVVSVNEMSLVLRKPVFGVSDLVRHKPGCTATEDG